MTKKYQIVGVGNALVDVLAHCDDSFLADMDIDKGLNAMSISFWAKTPLSQSPGNVYFMHNTYSDYGFEFY